MAGWQKQVGRRSAQGVLEEALLAVAGQAVAVTGAGRTDAGVHATGQVAHFDIMWPHSEQSLVGALNAQLPADVRAGGAWRVEESFHARHSARSRRYCYAVWVGEVAEPLAARWHHWVPEPLMLGWMVEAAAQFVGVHDFGAFGTAVASRGTTIRRVERFDVWRSGAQIVCEVVANAFLRHQVRRMVAAVLEVGQGRLAVSDLTRALWGAAPTPRFGRAPARGLTLAEVEYPGLAWPAGKGRQDIWSRRTEG